VQAQFIQFVAKNNLCATAQPVFVAVSGGIDSMVLLHLFVSTGFKVTAVHMNFGLRGEESEEDQSFVKARCAHLGVGFLSKVVTTKNYATERGVSVQMAARELRYEWFAELMRANKGSVVATAHHVNDSGETMLLNLIRGTGIDGLTGIPTRNDGIIRPLGFATRKQIDHYAAEHAITWREDESNLDDHYQRNFIRHRVMGLLKQINPSIEDTLSRNSSRLGGERELMERSLAELEKNLVLDKKNNIRIPKKALDGFIHKSGVLLRLIEPFGFNFSTAESIVAAMSGQPGKIFLSDTHTLDVDREDLIISSYQWPNVEVTTYETTDTNFNKDPNVAYLDADKIQFPLVTRRWKEGDWFQPLGMKGKKKVSDFLIDEKVSLVDKQSVVVMTSGDEIFWVVGMRIDDRFKITPATKRVLVCKKTNSPPIDGEL
jgi:tRNA(Ile)-lysidine synthase